jgi:hypothetical protein
MHAPGHLREAFVEWVEAGKPHDYVIPPEAFYDSTERPIRWLLGQLWHCSDQMSSNLRWQL